MLAHGGEIKVLDFGRAQLSEPELFGDGGSPASALSGREITEPRMPIDAMVTDSTERVGRRNVRFRQGRRQAMV